jgi:sugar/nucleoside kinase (ribokinase family)
MTARHGFICAGCWTLDRIKIIEAWPAEEELARITATDRQGGGSAHNVGIDLRKLDGNMPVAAIGLIGRDADGDFLCQTARDAGIDTTQLHRTDLAQTSYTDVMTVSRSGRRTFFHHAGANDHLSPDHFCFDNTQAKTLHLGLLGVHRLLDEPWNDDPNGWVTVLKKARAAGLQTNIELVSIDPARNRKLCLPCLPWLDTLIVNDHEIGALADIETIVDGVTVPERCREAARQILAAGTMRLVVVHYPHGADCITRDGQAHHADALSVDPDAIGSSVGAGDAFAAGTLYGLHENWSLDKALTLAHAAAATSLRSHTTVGSIETVQNCLALAARQNSRECPQ